MIDDVHLTWEEKEIQWTQFWRVTALLRFLHNEFADKAWEKLSQVNLQNALSWENKWKLVKWGVIAPHVTVIASDASPDLVGGLNFTKKTWFSFDVNDSENLTGLKFRKHFFRVHI